MMTILLKIWKSLKLPTSLQLFAMRRVNDQFLIGVTGIIFNDQNEILLIKHSYRDNGKWSLPGGYIKGKEHPKEGLEREIEEETGLVVSADERLKIRTDRHSSRLDIVYSGKLIGGEFKSSEEAQEVGFFKFDSLPQISKEQLIFIDRAMEKR
ncbi:hypothetical protein A2863_01420 [Candidatus Woesebacteria bacterium RIFCSPHIGHO2_01_FULL_38_9b]|uniref:Nudix hydrolase domain-containing protein n=1 Tax=Candidatus Woesebacteria bacterium RIFCSPHIGHO2_01_FULL_38_9b TaxID=1802493 RepID=A0A1F7Y1R6_9BACT|nr:MAG: hypothetical protein A2863_01420 [Candidatus Woesebacteria bacterium RIFCSPHIGHO2_01_FULL_38_9b]